MATGPGSRIPPGHAMDAGHRRAEHSGQLLGPFHRRHRLLRQPALRRALADRQQRRVLVWAGAVLVLSNGVEPLSPRERGWGEGTGEASRHKSLQEASPLPPSSPAGHLLSHEGGQCPSGRRSNPRRSIT
ncbi:hypothetical protein XAC3810_540003 [Xanthomonas citri pv. citri]|nr:hypothetical protein HZS91_03483 [Xanthomonas citri pv. citri]CEE33650.1 hypothetical protein XAC9322_530384 [Xanthomonas citri pv. citri]CEE34133.1 hypothetical protein XAC3824_710003 [Xanthomonas citri pv. citri]CEE35113.1 hypothetical protein XAC1083_530360 [Xanthomonas citri pv. citri]CEE44527.1 hypothetical protein XAC3810_540003 [Xanthomonas citri pv. citri]